MRKENHGEEAKALLSALIQKIDTRQLKEWFPDMEPGRVRSLLRGLTGDRDDAEPGPRSTAVTHPEPEQERGSGDEFVLFADGASRGNPGHAGAGFVLLDAQGQEVLTGSAYLGQCTNNVAEYRALIAGLEEATRLGCAKISIFLDSQLIVRQVDGTYRVKNVHLKPLFARVQELLSGFDSWRIRHVPRAENARADELANRGIDEGIRRR